MARILVVDDNDDVRQMVCEALELHDHEVRDAADGESALEQVERWRPELVITDIVMPEMEGIALIMELRSRAVPVRILAISGGGSFLADGYLRSAVMLGADRALEKPFTIRQLITTVDEVIHPEPMSRLDAAADGA